MVQQTWRRNIVWVNKWPARWVLTETWGLRSGLKEYVRVVPETDRSRHGDTAKQYDWVFPSKVWRGEPSDEKRDDVSPLDTMPKDLDYFQERKKRHFNPISMPLYQRFFFLRWLYFIKKLFIVCFFGLENASFYPATLMVRSSKLKQWNGSHFKITH